MAAKNEQDNATLTAFRAQMMAHARRQGISLDSLAEAAGTSKAYMNYLAHGQREPSLRTALGIARKLGVPLADMIVAADCAACGDLPPEGFRCLACGAEGQQP